MQNPTARRFVPKTFGRWFTPVTLQGRLCVVVLVAVIMWSAYEHNLFTETWPNWQEYIGFLVDIFVIVFSSLWYMDRHTDGDLKRRRGQKDK